MGVVVRDWIGPVRQIPRVQREIEPRQTKAVDLLTALAFRHRLGDLQEVIHVQPDGGGAIPASLNSFVL